MCTLRKAIEVEDNANDNSRLKDNEKKSELLDSVIEHDLKYYNILK